MERGSKKKKINQNADVKIKQKEEEKEAEKIRQKSVKIDQEVLSVIDFLEW